MNSEFAPSFLVHCHVSEPVVSRTRCFVEIVLLEFSPDPSDTKPFCRVDVHLYYIYGRFVMLTPLILSVKIPAAHASKFKSNHRLHEIFVPSLSRHINRIKIEATGAITCLRGERVKGCSALYIRAVRKCDTVNGNCKREFSMQTTDNFASQAFSEMCTQLGASRSRKPSFTGTEKDLNCRKQSSKKSATHLRVIGGADGFAHVRRLGPR